MAGEGFVAPHVDYAGLAPVIALTVGLVVILMSGVFGPTKRWAPGLAVLTLGAAAGLLIWHWNDNLSLVVGRAAGRQPGDLDLADRDRRAPSSRSCCRSASGRPTKPGTASTTRC